MKSLMLGEQDLDKYLSAVVGTLSKSDAKRENEFWKAPDLLEEVEAGRLPLGHFLTPDEGEEFRALLSGLIGLFVRRHFREARPTWQLNLVHKFIFPQKFEVSWKLIEKLSKKYESGHLIRAWAVRRLMYELADLLELSNPEAEDPSSSTVFISPGADQKHRLYPLVRRYCKRRTKLQSLAIRIYLDLIHSKNEDPTIDERSLRRDLKRLRAWEDGDPIHTQLKKEYAAGGDKFHWKARIPIRLYSESFRPETPAEEAESELLESLRDDKDIPEE